MHELIEHRRAQPSSGRASAHRPRLIISDIASSNDVAGETDKPDIPGIVGGAGLPSYGHFKIYPPHRGATLDNTLHHRRELIGGYRIHYALPVRDDPRPDSRIKQLLLAVFTDAAVMAVNCFAPTVLDPVNQCRFNPLAAIGKHRIGGDHPEQRALLTSKRVGKIRLQPVVDSEPLGVGCHGFHSDFTGQAHRHQIPGPFDAGPQGGRAVESVRRVCRPPDLGTGVDTDWRIDHNGRWRESAIERCSVYKGLEG